MATKTSNVDQIVTQAQQLSPDDRLRLIQRLAETLIPTVQKPEHRRLIYGEFKGENMSTEDDFLNAEWHPIIW